VPHAEYDLLIQSMSRFLRGETHTTEADTDTWKALCLLAQRQSLSGALCVTAAGSPMPKAVASRLQQDAAKTLSKSEEQMRSFDEITAALSAAGVTHLIFKGAVIRGYYPDPLMRSMGDIDMAVRFEDRDAAYAAMTAIGFTCAEKTEEVWTYRRFQTSVEMHTIIKTFNAHEQQTQEYDHIFEDTVPVSGTTVRWSDKKEAAHCISHLTAHFCAGGCGLRQLMDVAVLYERFPDKVLWETVLDDLRPMGIDGFARRLLWLCREWFGVAVDETLVTALSDEDAARMKDRLLSDGTFGTDARMAFAEMRRDRKKKRSRTAAFFRRLFPPIIYLRRRYGYIERHPWLFPVGYCHRAYDGLFKNRRTHQIRRQYARQNEHDIDAELAFFDALGL